MRGYSARFSASTRNVRERPGRVAPMPEQSRSDLAADARHQCGLSAFDRGLNDPATSPQAGLRVAGRLALAAVFCIKGVLTSAESAHEPWGHE